MMNKNYIYLTIGAVVVIGTSVFLMQGGVSNNNLSPSESPQLTPDPTPVPTTTPKLTGTVKPSPHIKAEVNNHEYMALTFDEDGNRRLVLNENCDALVPSQVAYHNNVQLMLDNTYSTQAHVLRIGSVDYRLEAGEWKLITLSSSTLPASFTIRCGAMELGQLDLLAN